MRDISDKILSGAGRYTSRLVWDGGELSGEMIRDWTVTSSLTGSSDRLTLGATPAAQLTANVVTDAKLLDRRVRLYIGRGGEEISVGVFTVTDAPAVDGVVTLTGYDAMYTAMEWGYYPTGSGETTARAVLADAAQAAGLALVLPDGLDAPVSGVSGGYTLREVVGYMAALLGCNARIDGDGALRVQWFADSGLTLDGDSIYSGGAALNSEDWTLGKLTCSVTTATTTTDEDGVTSRTDSTETLTSGSGATGVSFSNPWMTQSLLDSIFEHIGMTYRSGEVSALGDLRVEVGDVVTALDEAFPVMAQMLEYDGGLRMTLSAYAESESDGGGEGVSGPMTTAMERYAVELAQIRELDTQRAKITRAHINQLKADKADVDDLTAIKADIETLTADKLDAEDAAIKYATIDFSNIGEAAVTKLFTAAGIIKDLVVSEGHITGELVGVTIKGDLIEGGTVKADRLVVKGGDGLYYKLNTDGETVEAEQTTENSLNGSVIAAKSITATKVAVDDLVAFGATIGGFHLSANSMYSGAKAGVDNTTQGIYMDSTGQIATGDSTRYLKHYKDAAGTWHLEICTDELLLSSGKTVSGAISAAQAAADKAQESVDGLEVGGRNLLLRSKTLENFAIENSERATWSDNVLTRLRVQPGAYYGIYFDFLNFTPGTTYTFSIRVSDLTTNGTIKLCAGSRVSGGIWMGYGERTITANGHCTFTFTVKSNETGVRLYVASNTIGTSAKITEAKLEQGNIATDWTPAPEDVDTDISAVTDRVTKVETSIKQNSEAIALKASQEAVDAVTETVEKHEAKLEVCITTDQDDRSKVISAINASADAIALKSDRLTIESTNFQLTADGTVTAKAGNIGGWDIQKDRLRTTQGSKSYSDGTLSGEYHISAELTPPSESIAPGVTISASGWDSDGSWNGAGGLAAVLIDSDDPTRGLRGVELYFSNGSNYSYIRAKGTGVECSLLANLPKVGGAAIAAGTDLNDLTDRGKYYVPDNNTAATLLHRPTNYAGALYCLYPLDPTAERLAGWGYLVQVYLSYQAEVFLRPVSRDGATGAVYYGAWRKLSGVEV